MVNEIYKVTATWSDHYEAWEYFTSSSDALNTAKRLAKDLQCYEVIKNIKWAGIKAPVVIEISTDIIHTSLLDDNILPDSFRQMVSDIRDDQEAADVGTSL